MKIDFKLYSILFILLLGAALAGCAGNNSSTDQVFTAPDFSVAVQVNSSQETHATLIVTNHSDTPFPADDNFNGVMTLWYQNSEPRARVEAHTIQKIAPGESIFLASSSWKLDKGTYYLTWGAPDYGGVISVFTVVEEDNRLYLGTEQTFKTKPAQFDETIKRAGLTKSFQIKADGTVRLQGETPLPDGACVFPVLVDSSGIVAGYPAGQCAQIADGQWQLEIPADPSSSSALIEEASDYTVVVFSNDLTIPPSEPFEIYISPPQND